MSAFDRLPGAGRNMHLWLPGYRRACRRRRREPRAARVWLTIADHYEPCWGKPADQTARERVGIWRRLWPEIAARHRDSAGHPPRYTFFYPQEEYQPYLLAPLAEMKAAGIADVEVHIHHDGEGQQNFLDRMRWFTETLFRNHGLLRKLGGKIAFSFIHGNWALDNSRPDGRWCGLNNEITLLRDLGCYADYTLPSAPDPAQTPIVNTIYWATDDPQRPRSHEHGVPLIPGGGVEGDLLLIPGPLCFNWQDRRRLVFPRLEVGELAGYDRPTRHRVRLWLKHAPRVGSDVFIKLFSHGAQERNLKTLLYGDLDQIFRDLAAECAELGIPFYFTTAWEMWRAVDALRRQTDPVAEAFVN